MIGSIDFDNEDETPEVQAPSVFPVKKINYLNYLRLLFNLLFGGMNNIHTNCIHI